MPELTGEAIAAAIGRLVPPGKEVEVGPNAVFDALTAIGGGKTIDLQGAATDLDFDLSSGEAPSDFALLCAGVDARGRANHETESGVFLRARSGKIEGVMRCP